MLDSITLPQFSKVKALESKGNFAVSRYYKFPFSFFYCHKLKMIIKMLEPKIYRNILDFGSGEANIFNKELSKHCLKVVPIEYKEEIDSRSKFDVVVCGSVLEFCNLTSTLSILRNVTARNGMIIVASPMKTWLTDLYFRLIGDNKKRHSHQEIRNEIFKYFFVVKYKTWLGLYFCLKGYRK